MAQAWPGFAERLRQAREESQFSIEAAAQKIGVTAERWREWEDGGDDPSFQEGMAVCRLLAITPDWALNLKADEPR